MRMNILIILNDCCDDYLLEYESICSKYITNVKSFGKKKNNMKPAAIATSNNNNWRSSVATIAKCTQTFCMKMVFSLPLSLCVHIEYERKWSFFHDEHKNHFMIQPPKKTTSRCTCALASAYK